MDVYVLYFIQPANSEDNVLRQQIIIRVWSFGSIIIFISFDSTITIVKLHGAWWFRLEALCSSFGNRSAKS